MARRERARRHRIVREWRWTAYVVGFDVGGFGVLGWVIGGGVRSYKGTSTVIADGLEVRGGRGIYISLSGSSTINPHRLSSTQLF